MLALAGFPVTAGFFGKIYLINAAVNNGYGWLGVVIVIGSAVSLAYYLKVVAAVWMREAPSTSTTLSAVPVMAGGSSENDEADRARGVEPGADVGRVVSEDFGEPSVITSGARISQPEVVFVAVVCSLVTIAFGVYPEPLFDVARDAGEAFRSLI
jgi:NADH-quinone oxidoreductase subunit N